MTGTSLDQSMISECLYLYLGTDFCEFICGDILYILDASSEFEEFSPCDWTNSRDFFENIFFHTFHTSSLIRGDRESMGLVTSLLEYHEFRHSFLEENWILQSWKEYLFFTFCDRTDRSFEVLEGSSVGRLVSSRRILRFPRDRSNTGGFLSFG